MGSISAPLPAFARWRGPARDAGRRSSKLPLSADREPASLSRLKDQELATMAIRNHQGAYRELVVRYQRPIFSLVFRLVRDRELAEDLTQEAFIRAFGALRSYKPSYKFSSWIFKIANNHAIDHLRRRRIETVSLDGSIHASTPDEVERTSRDLPSQAETPEQYVESRELGEQLERAIAELRVEYRSVILLRHVEGYAYAEIAEILGIPLGTVKTYVHRARNELRSRLAPVVG